MKESSIDTLRKKTIKSILLLKNFSRWKFDKYKKYFAMLHSYIRKFLTQL